MPAKTKKLGNAQQRAVMESCCQGAAAWAVGLATRTLRDKSAPTNADGSYDISKVVAWSRDIDGRRQVEIDPDDICDKARKLRAEADLKEMQAEERAGRLCPADMVEALLGRIADGLRELGEDFGRSAIPISGRDAQKKVNDMIDSIEWS
jgi:hypothetical protein